MKRLYRHGLLKPLGILFVVLVLAASYANAASLEEIITTAAKLSPSMQLLELNKLQNDISLGLGNVEDVLSITVESGNLALDSRTYEVGGASKQSLSLGPEVVLVLPNDENTKITVGLSDVAFALDGSAWSISPVVEVNHVVTLGNDGDDLSALNLARQTLEIDHGYDQGKLNFENTVYQKIIELLGYEKTLLSAAHDIAAQETKMANALALRSATRESATYKSMELALAKLKNNQTAVQRKLELAKEQYLQTTGTPWDSVESIGDVELAVTAMPTGDATVVIAALDVQIAKEELAVEENPASRKLTISGSAGLVSRAASTSSTTYSVTAGASLALDQVSVAATADLAFVNGVATPALTVAGSWNNNASSQSEQLNVQKLRNEVAIAELDYQQAMVDYLESVNTLQNDILSHQIEVEQLDQTEAYDQQVLDQARLALQKGLGTASAVEDAELTLELDAFERLGLQLEARLLQNKIKLLQL